MNIESNKDTAGLAGRAAAGDQKALEELIVSVQDMVFNLSLRMLGNFPDAEDASQEILLKVITHLSSFRGESAFSTWVFKIAVNHLKDYKKGMFFSHPLSFEYYGDDIVNGAVRDIPDLTQNVEKAILAEELKMSCTNVMLQCLDSESRIIFILGTMFHLDSRIAGEILNITPDAYRKRLQRVRQKMAEFLESYCGEYGHGTCRCKDRINYAVKSHRLNPENLEYTSKAELTKPVLSQVKNAMEEIDDLAGSFLFCKAYEPPERTRQFMRDFLESAQLSAVQNSALNETFKGV